MSNQFQCLEYYIMVRKYGVSQHSQKVRVLMRVLFGVFLFLFFFYYQYPLLELTQYQLSGGQTVYRPLISALVLTGLLVSAQRLVEKWIPFSDNLYFFSYLPSVIASILFIAFTPKTNGILLMFAGFAFVIFVLIVCLILRNVSGVKAGSDSVPELFSKHFAALVLACLMIGATANSREVLAYEIKVAGLIKEGKYDEALEIGRNSLATSSRLSALRALALSRSSLGLGEGLFSYPLSEGGAKQLLLEPADTTVSLLPPDSLYAQWGVWPSSRETPIEYFYRAASRTTDSTVVGDYLLASLLLERDLDRFVEVLPDYYAISDTVEIPRYFSEALAVYVHLKGKTENVSVDSALMKNYEDFLHYGEQYRDLIVRRNYWRRKYADTYWTYFYLQ